LKVVALLDDLKSRALDRLAQLPERERRNMPGIFIEIIAEPPTSFGTFKPTGQAYWAFLGTLPFSTLARNKRGWTRTTSQDRAARPADSTVPSTGTARVVDRDRWHHGATMDEPEASRWISDEDQNRC
jgi:hypothetical protein